MAITILVRNPDAGHEGCRILYRDIGDYLKREEKLVILGEAGSITGIKDWQEITPDRHHDWIGQRDEAFQKLYPMGSKAAKAGEVGSDAIFKLFSNGYKTSRDAYIYNFSRDACAENARAMVGDYQGAMEIREKHPDYTVDDVVNLYSSNVRWDRELKNNLRRRKNVSYSPERVWTTQYRPFVKQRCYVEYVLVNNKYQMDSIFPTPDRENRAICVPGISSTKPFSALVVDTIPDLNFESAGAQCFPRYRYAYRPGGGLLGERARLERIENISDTALAAFRAHYNDNSISKDAIFDYVYGILHASGYRERFANDLAKELPRIPMAPDFSTFAEAGRALAELHLGYETGEEYPLEVAFAHSGEPRPEHFRIGQRAMGFDDDKRTVLRVNEHVCLRGIPDAAHRYQVNGRTPLEWFIDRYRITQDKASGILNDPNEWFDDPRDLIAAVCRIVHLSVETVRIVEGLPKAFTMEPHSRCKVKKR